MDARPLVSIVLPTYNRERYLREAVESVLAQTYRRWELIVVDDGSTDATREYVDRLRDPRVRPVYCPHSGNPGRLRNRGAATAKGTCLAFLDSDDTWHPRKLEWQIEDLLQHQECGWAYAYCERMGPAGEPLPLPPGGAGTPERGWITEKLVTVEAVVTLPTVLVTLELFQKVGGFDESFHFFEDYELWTRCSLASPVTLITEPLARVRDHPGSYSLGRIEVLGDWARMTDKVRAGTTDAHLRRLCRVQKGRILLRLAARYRHDARYGASLQTLLRAVPYQRQPAAWALECLKTILRPATPGPLLRRYRRSAGRWGRT